MSILVHQWRVVYQASWCEAQNVDQIEQVNTRSNDPTKVVRIALNEALGTDVCDIYDLEEVKLRLVLVLDPHGQDMKALVDLDAAMGYGHP